MQTPLKSPHVGLGASPPQELLDSTAYLLKRLGWACKDRAVAAFGVVGAMPYHPGVLAVLAEGDSQTPAAIAHPPGPERSDPRGLPAQLRDRRPASAQR